MVHASNPPGSPVNLFLLLPQYSNVGQHLKTLRPDRSQETSIIRRVSVLASLAYSSLFSPVQHRPQSLLPSVQRPDQIIWHRLAQSTQALARPDRFAFP